MTTPTRSKIAYIARPGDYPIWSAEERGEVETWLRALEIDPHDVPVNRNAESIVVRAHPDGTLELDLWVYERNEEGCLTACDTCPCCARQKRVKVPVTEPVPSVFGERRPASMPSFQDGGPVPSGPPPLIEVSGCIAPWIYPSAPADATEEPS